MGKWAQLFNAVSGDISSWKDSVLVKCLRLFWIQVRCHLSSRIHWVSLRIRWSCCIFNHIHEFLKLLRVLGLTNLPAFPQAPPSESLVLIQQTVKAYSYVSGRAALLELPTGPTLGRNWNSFLNSKFLMKQLLRFFILSSSQSDLGGESSGTECVCDTQSPDSERNHIAQLEGSRDFPPFYPQIAGKRDYLKMGRDYVLFDILKIFRFKLLVCINDKHLYIHVSITLATS